MPSIKEFEAWILFSGSILREYGTWTEGNTVHCFVPSFPGVVSCIESDLFYDDADALPAVFSPLEGLWQQKVHFRLYPCGRLSRTRQIS